MGLYENIRDIAKSKGYSVNKLEQELGFARSSINKFNKICLALRNCNRLRTC